MAQQDIVIGAANKGNGDTLFDAFTKVQANFDELYGDDAGDVNSVNGQTGTVVLDSDDVSEGTTNLYNATHTGDVTGATALTIADDVIDYAKLGAEFTTTDAITTDLDFSGHQVFTKTMLADTTFTFSNANIGMVKDFILEVNYTPTFPSGTKTVSGTYSTTAANLIQIVAVASGDYWMSISQSQ
jgi:hypothetical protein